MDKRDTPPPPREASAGAEEMARSGSMRSLAADPFASLPMDFGPYRVLKLIGRGGMGAVYLARDPGQNRDVAIKVARTSAAGSRSLQSRMEREARALALLDHPNICKLYDFGAVGEIRYLALEYIEGENLKSAMARVGRKRKPANAVQMMIQLARAVGTAHERGIIHRDLKPDNVMRRPSGRLVIMDFGLNRQSVQRNWDPEKTRDGAVLGTPAYMSPEQAEGLVDQVDERSDIYSLGVMLFEMLTGEWPFQGTSISIMGQKITKPTPDILGFNAALPPGLAAICQKMVAQRRENRYASCAEVVQALREVDLESSPVETTAVGAASETTDLFEFLREADSAGAPLHQRVLGRRPVERASRFAPWGRAAIRPVAKLARGAWNWWSGQARSMQWALAAATGVLATLAVVLFSSIQPPPGEVADSTSSPSLAAASTDLSSEMPASGLPAETSEQLEPSSSAIAPIEPLNVAATPAPMTTPPESPDQSPQPIASPAPPASPQGTTPAYVELPRFELAKTGSLTLEMTVDAQRPSSIGREGVVSGTILSNQREEGLSLRATQLGIDFEIHARQQSVMVPNRVFSSGAPWYNGRTVLAAVLDRERSELRFYVNGWLAQKRPFQGTLTNTTHPLLIGAERDELNRPVQGFVGTIDEIRISSVDRYRNEYEPVSRLSLDASTLALYHCDEGFGDRLLDSSPAKENGRVYGVNWVARPGAAPGTSSRVDFMLSFPGPSPAGNESSSAPAEVTPLPSLDGLPKVTVQPKGKSRPTLPERTAVPQVKRGPFVARSGVITGKGMWRIIGDDLVQMQSTGHSVLLFGSPAWRDYTVSFDAMRVSGTEGYQLFFRSQSDTHTKFFGIGSYKNTWHEIASLVQGKWERQNGSAVMGSLRDRAWERVRVSVVGDKIQCFLNDEMIREEKDARFPQGGVGLQTWEAAVRFRNFVVTAPDGTILWEGFPVIPPH